MSLKDRLNLIIETIGVDKKDLAEQCGIARATIFNYLNGKSVPDAKFLHELKKHYPQVNLDWLITGEGEQYLYNKEGSDNVVPMDPDMGMAMEIVAEVEEEQGVEISSPQREELIKLIYKEALKHKAEARAEAKSKYRGLMNSFKRKKD